MTVFLYHSIRPRLRCPALPYRRHFLRAAVRSAAGQSVQYAADVFGGDCFFKEDLKLLVCQLYAFEQHTFKQSHTLA